VGACFGVRLVVCTINAALYFVDLGFDSVGWVLLIVLNGCTFWGLKDLGPLLVPWSN
jgi:hypothetical protein